MESKAEARTNMPSVTSPLITDSPSLYFASFCLDLSDCCAAKGSTTRDNDAKDEAPEVTVEYTYPDVPSNNSVSEHSLLQM